MFRFLPCTQWHQGGAWTAPGSFWSTTTVPKTYSRSHREPSSATRRTRGPAHIPELNITVWDSKKREKTPRWKTDRLNPQISFFTSVHLEHVNWYYIHGLVFERFLFFFKLLKPKTFAQCSLCVSLYGQSSTILLFFWESGCSRVIPGPGWVGGPRFAGSSRHNS